MRIDKTQIGLLSIDDSLISISANISELKIENGGHFILKDGSRAMEGNLSLGSNYIVSLADAVSLTDAVTLSQLLQKSWNQTYQETVALIQTNSDVLPEEDGTRVIIGNAVNLPAQLQLIPGLKNNDIVEFVSEEEGWVISYSSLNSAHLDFKPKMAFVEEKGVIYYYNGSGWLGLGNLDTLVAGDGLEKIDADTLGLKIGLGLKFDNDDKLAINYNPAKFSIIAGGFLSLRSGSIDVSDIDFSSGLGKGIVYNEVLEKMELNVDPTFFEFESFPERLTLKNNSISGAQIQDGSINTDKMANFWGKGLIRDGNEIRADLDETTLTFSDGTPEAQIELKQVYAENLNIDVAGNGLSLNSVSNALQVNLDPNSLEFTVTGAVTVKLNGDTLERTSGGLRLRAWGAGYSIIGSDTNQIQPVKNIVRGLLLGETDGLNTTFYTEYLPVEDSEEIFVSGLAKVRGTDYSIDYDTGEVVFGSAPLISDWVRINYKGLRRI